MNIHPQPEPPFSETNQDTPEIGGGLPVIEYWAEHTLSPEGPKLWKTLLHHSACLSCSWGTGGQKGGFTNEEGEKLQRCMKSVEAISAEIKPAIREEFFDTRSLTQLQRLTSMEADRLGRWSFPVIHRAGSDRYERISWEEIYTIATAAFQKPPERIASYSSGRGSNEAAFLLQLMLRTLGSNNLADCSDLCHAPSTTALKEMFGTNTSIVSLESLKQADCVVLAGANSAYNHPRLMNELIKLRERGGRVIVINPVMEIGLVKFGSPAFPIKSLIPGSDIASLYLQPIPGSDVALFVGIQKALMERGYVDRAFLEAHTEGWQSVLEQARSLDWDTLTATCGVSQSEIETAAEIIGTSKGVVFGWAMGITQHTNGVDNVYSIANTALISGQIAKMGAGVMPVRGHSNVQGFGSMGVTVKLKKEILQALEQLLGRSLNLPKGYHTRDLIEAAVAGKVDSLLCVGGNLYGANPDSAQAKRALGNIETIIYLATKPNIGHFHGLAKTNTIIIPGYEKIGEIDDTKEEFTISGRIVTEPHFKTPSGKAKMFTTPLPTLTLPDVSEFGMEEPANILVLALMTGRSYSQHNTVVYKIGDKYRGMPHRHCILMNRLDAEKIGLAEHDRVTVKGDVDKLDNIEVIYGAVREGAALMFYPEVNVIFKAKTETRSGTPAYKRVPVLVYNKERSPRLD
jgi:molybdopterin-dependent oxidoreductase alpha subunit